MKNFNFLLFLISVTISAQKVDLDRFYFDVSYQQLPEEPFFEKNLFFKVKLGVKYKPILIHLNEKK
jgi:hypothetical protein